MTAYPHQPGYPSPRSPRRATRPATASPARRGRPLPRPLQPEHPRHGTEPVPRRDLPRPAGPGGHGRAPLRLVRPVPHRALAPAGAPAAGAGRAARTLASALQAAASSTRIGRRRRRAAGSFVLATDFDPRRLPGPRPGLATASRHARDRLPAAGPRHLGRRRQRACRLPPPAWLTRGMHTCPCAGAGVLRRLRAPGTRPGWTCCGEDRGPGLAAACSPILLTALTSCAPGDVG